MVRFIDFETFHPPSSVHIPRRLRSPYNVIFRVTASQTAGNCVWWPSRRVRNASRLTARCSVASRILLSFTNHGRSSPSYCSRVPHHCYTCPRCVSHVASNRDATHCLRYPYGGSYHIHLAMCTSANNPLCRIAPHWVDQYRPYRL